MAPIVDNGDGARIEYHIPAEIQERIPKYFYTALAGELFSIYGWERSQRLFYPEEDKHYADLNSSSAGWVQAFRATCRKLGMDWLYEYYQSLEWYDSDVFDGIIEQEIWRHFMRGKDDGISDYYRHLCSEDNYGGKNEH